ncbi:DMT family transporter [Jannaschia formosa]|uniref:DMT family transporter n=1 Tax=Jannaschia formosa TaxID=2259592 RepID=UPI000E1C0671|nr:DMT family transporter [Jannaschia formosa]TFL17191.1 hypothetical protein DR046_16065 [Jannaschia formosa]
MTATLAFLVVLALGVMALVADRLGFAGRATVAITWARVLSVALVAAGVALFFQPD